jgi:hypothetical protein
LTIHPASRPPFVARLVPPATVIDKTVYSSWTESRLDGLLAADAVCGFADETHDAAMIIFAHRFGEQVELASTEEILTAWP